MSLRYIGSKARVAAEIGAVLGRRRGTGRFIDAFCGTGVVAREAANLGWPVWVNDHLTSSVATAVGQVVAVTDVPFRTLGSYELVIAALNALNGTNGFVWREYSPASAANGVERRYFTTTNASRIDAMRIQITRWVAAGDVTLMEARLLIADLLAAVNRVANIAGTYGCFLRHWTSNAQREVRLAPRALRSRSTPLEVSCLDVFDIGARRQDTVYLDPPYTKRQYAAYYHVLETIAEGDSPQVGGVTGLRPWGHKASPFCYKARALGALVSLVAKLEAERVLISYSDEGHISLDDLRPRLSELGALREHHLASVGRYRPNERASANGSSVAEHLLDLRRRQVGGSSRSRTRTAVTA